MIVRSTQRSHPDRRAGGQRPRRALRRAQPGRVAHRQRVPRSRAERAPQHGSRVRRHRARPQRRALLRRGRLGCRRDGQPAAPHRAGAEDRRPCARAGDEGPRRPQGRAPDEPDLAPRPLPRLRARRCHERHLAEAPRHRARAPQEDPQGGAPRVVGRHRPHRRRGRHRGPAHPRRAAPHQPVGAHLEADRDDPGAGAAALRARPAGQDRPRRLQRGLLEDAHPGRGRAPHHLEVPRVASRPTSSTASSATRATRTRSTRSV